MHAWQCISRVDLSDQWVGYRNELERDQTTFHVHAEKIRFGRITTFDGMPNVFLTNSFDEIQERSTLRLSFAYAR